jgi:hypothetical protein
MPKRYHSPVFLSFCTIAMAGLLSGCGSAPIQQVASPAPKSDPAPAPVARLPETRPAIVFIDLSMYQIYVPAGSISGNDEFWANLVPADMDASADNLLNSNGIRVAQGNVSDWPVSKKILDLAGADTIRNHYIAPRARGQEIPVSEDQVEQTLFWFDGRGLSGQVYDHCQNLLVLAFSPTPDRAECVHLELSPLVRATRKHYEYTVLNGQNVVSFVNEEHLYDVGLSADLQVGKFLVVAPSSQSSRTTSIGHQFFTQDDKSHRREMVMIFVVNPTPKQLNAQYVRP